MNVVSPWIEPTLIYIGTQFLFVPGNVGISWPTLSLSGMCYLHGSCYTEPNLRSRLLRTSFPPKFTLFRILLHLESIPYPWFSSHGLMLIACNTSLQFSNQSYYFGDLNPESISVLRICALMIFISQVLTATISEHFNQLKAEKLSVYRAWF